MASIDLSEGGAYTNMKAALAAASGGTDTVDITGTWSAPDTTTGAVTTANVTVTTDSASANPGHSTGSPTHYQLQVGSGHSIQLDHSMTITGVDIGSQSTGVSDEIFRVNASNVTLTAKKCLFWFNSRNAEQDVLYTDSNSGLVAEFENCAFWNVYRSIVDHFSLTAETVTVKFNSCHGYDIGFSAIAGNRSGVYGASTTATGSISNVFMFNCVWHINTGNVFNASIVGTHNLTADRTLSSTTSGDWSTNVDTEALTDIGYSYTWTAGTPGVGSVIGVNDITGGAMDLRLQDHANNDAQDNHTDASGATLSMPSTDIIGTSRPQNTNYDVGFFEISVGGGGATGKSNPLSGPFGGPLAGPIG